MPVWLLARRIPGSGVPARILVWIAGLGVLALVGARVERILARRLPASTAANRLLDGALMFALSSAVGWGIDVRVGGPLSGLAVARLFGIGDTAASPRVAWRCAAMLAAVVGGATLLLGRPGDPASALRGLAGVTFGGLVGLATLPRAALLRTGVLVVAWAGAWVGAYYLTGRVPLPSLGGYGGTGAEVALAFAAGGVATGAVLRGWRPALSLAVAGLAAATIAAGGDLVLRLLRSLLTGPDGWSRSHLAVTQTVCMGVLAGLAAWWDSHGGESLPLQAVHGREEVKHERGRPA